MQRAPKSCGNPSDPVDTSTLAGPPFLAAFLSFLVLLESIVLFLLQEKLHITHMFSFKNPESMPSPLMYVQVGNHTLYTCQTNWQQLIHSKLYVSFLSHMGRVYSLGPSEIWEGEKYKQLRTLY